MKGVTAPVSDRLIGAAPVGDAHDRPSGDAGSFGATDFAPRRVSEQPSSEFSANNAWNQNYVTSSPGAQNNNINKNNNNRARAVRRTEPPTCNVTIEELFKAYYDCRTRKRNSVLALAFERRLERNLMDLYHALHDGSYTPGRSICFAVLYPRPREVWAADFRDRIVHHLIYNRVAERTHRRFIADTCACIPGRGTLYAVQRVERHLRSATQNWTQAKWVLQMDIANFFVSIDKGVLDGLLEAGIEDDYALHLARVVLHRDPTHDPIYTGNPDHLKQIPPHKSLFNAGGNGLPIGNLTSQFEANVYLDPLDQYAKRVLKLRHYARYMDDILIVGDSPGQLQDIAQALQTFAHERLRLTFHPRKTHIQRAEQGIDFVGWIIRPHARYLRRRTIRRAHHTLRTGAENLLASINSYFGLMRRANAYRQRACLADKARNAGLRPNPALTKVTPCNT